MARHKGQNGVVEVGGVEISERVSFDLEISAAELDASVQGSNWTDVDSGQLSASGSIEVLWDPANAGQTALAVGSTVTLTLFPGGDTTGLRQISGDFLITSKGVTSSVGDLVKSTFNVKNAGAVTDTAIS